MVIDSNVLVVNTLKSDDRQSEKCDVEKWSDQCVARLLGSPPPPFRKKKTQKRGSKQTVCVVLEFHSRIARKVGAAAAQFAASINFGVRMAGYF